MFTGCTNDRNTLLMNQNDCQLWRLRQSFCGKKKVLLEIKFTSYTSDTNTLGIGIAQLVEH